jgi:hypothetical protein
MTFTKGKSGNPRGRPKKGAALSERLRYRIESAEGDRIIDSLISQALDGNVPALKLIFDRLEGSDPLLRVEVENLEGILKTIEQEK